MTNRKFLGLLVAGAVALTLGAEARAASPYYQGKTLTIVVPYGPGGGYDTWARLLRPYLKRYLGVGEVIVRNRPGGGGLVGTNTVYRATADGLTIGDTNAAGDVFAQMANAPGVNFNVAKFSWIGRPDNDPHIVAVHPASPYKSFDDLVALKSGGKTIRALATGKGSSDYNAAVILYNAFHIPFHMVAAFKGSHAEKATFVAGEGDTISVSASDIAQLGSKEARVVLLMTAEPFARLPNVPTVVAEARKHRLPEKTVHVLTMTSEVMAMGHAFFAPPAVPAARLTELRTAFDKALHNKAFLAQAEKAGLYTGYESAGRLERIAQAAFRNKAEFAPFLKSR